MWLRKIEIQARTAARSRAGASSFAASFSSIYLMDSNGWYSQSGFQEEVRHPPQSQANRVAMSSVQGAHGLLAVYPVSSATPSSQGMHACFCLVLRIYANALSAARHLNHLSMYAVPPSYVQPHVYRTPESYGYPHLPSTSDFAYDIGRMDPNMSSAPDRRYWENARNEAVRHLEGQGLCVIFVPIVTSPSNKRSGHSYQVTQTPWALPYSQTSTYQTSPFAHSVLQHSLPSSAYPTPPPPSVRISSASSLANALGPPTSRPTKVAYAAEESATFFNDFVGQSANVAAQPPPPHAIQTHTRPSIAPQPDSPDPLRLAPSHKTPHKRPSNDFPASPTPKRRQVRDDPQTPRVPSTTQPPGPSPSRPTTSSPFKARLQPYVDVPPRPTPLKPKLSPYVDIPVFGRFPATPATGKRKRQLDDDESADLGGYGSVDGSPAKYVYASSPVKSPAKRATGERDERGEYNHRSTEVQEAHLSS